jgi:hypothetical protein
MKTRWSVLLSLVFAIVGLHATESKQPPRSSEQLEFSAEDAGVKKPVAIPEDVLAILKKDKSVQDAVEDGGSPQSSWFSASEIHLSTADRRDLIVVGEPPLSGANTATFWVFCATHNSYQLVLNAPAHDLIVKNTRWKGYREIEMSAETAVEFTSVLFRFDGKRYTEYRTKSEPIR